MELAKGAATQAAGGKAGAGWIANSERRAGTARCSACSVGFGGKKKTVAAGLRVGPARPMA